MAQDIVNENQSLSYTNLDFSSIYTEVLDMVKQLTKKWDPSISNESDPGVVLVKLSALLADKCNYNIDKNILEAFPLSVTQDSNARQLYEQLGYYMHWYKAATVPVSISWKTTTVTEKGEAIAYTIPKFTTITDDDETIVYSLVGTQGPDEIVVSDGILYTDSSKNLNMIAYEGIPVQYTFNDRTTITANMVDNNNRLYLSTAYAFENGIFIKNVTQDNYAEWHRVDNLYEYSYDEHRYKFGYDSAANLCYIEFPDNYAELFGSGIELVYLTFSTNESYSDVPTQFLSKFLSPPMVGENNAVTLTQDVVNISNIEPASGHAEKEDINEAYTNYKKVVGTFNTLITLRDYINYITSKELDICSNGFVDDRTNDVQSTYKIISKKNGIDSLITEVEEDPDVARFVKTKDEDLITGKTYYSKVDNEFLIVDSPSIEDLSTYYELIGDDILSPFSLKFYLLQKAVALTARGAYDNTFEMSNSKDLDMDSLLNNTAHLVHSFEDVLPLGENTYKVTTDTSVPVDSSGTPTKIYYIYNKPRGRYEPVPVTSLDYQTYNPHEMGLYEFTPEYVMSTDTEWYTGVTYYVYNSITGNYDEYTETHDATPATHNPTIYNQIPEYSLTNDTQINATKAANDAYFEYDPITASYVVAELPEEGVALNPQSLGLYEVDVEALLPHIVFFKNKYPITMNISTYNSVNKTAREEILTNIITAFYNNLDSSNIEFGDSISLDYLTEIAKNSDTRIKNVAYEALSYTTYAIYWDEDNNTFVEIALPSNSSQVGLVNIASLPTYDNVIAYLFSKDIICKSILAGTTQLLVPDDTFAYHLNQEYINQISGIKYITGEAVINTNAQESHYIISEDEPEIMKSYVLQENETISLFRPAIIDVETYTSGVHYEYLTHTDIKAGQSRQLQSGEYFIFYISNVDSDGILQSFTVYVYGKDAIIHPTFDIEARSSLSTYGGTVAVAIASSAGAMSQLSVDTKVYSYNESRQDKVSQINNDTSINNTKIGTNNSISAQKLDRFTVEESDGYRLMWHLNTPTYEGTTKQYELFPAFDSSDENDVNNYEKINSYTLKSGEYLYYTDQYMSSLGILGAGTTVTRNCGTTNFEITPIDSLPFVFVKWSNITSMSGNSFISLVDTNNNFDAHLNGLFTLNNGVPSRAASGTSASNCYALLIRDVSGWYIQGEGEFSDEYTLTYPPTTTVFSAIIPDSSQSINPSANGWFEIVTFGDSQIADTYFMPSKVCADSADYIANESARSSSNTLLRYTLTEDTEVVEGKVYYKPNTYAIKKFKKVDPLVCPAIDTLDLSTNPLQVMRKLFQKVQTNTSLTFTRNELWTISENDTIYIQTPQSKYSETGFPIFTNTESTLDLDKYSISYKRVGDDVVTVDNISIENCYWQGYSNLQLNTNTDNGQALLPNHSLTVYGTDMTVPIDDPIYGNSNTNIHFQLQYPVVNRTGSFIQVDTSSVTQEEILNTLYVYNVSPDTDDYEFSTDNYNTYVYVKKSGTPLPYSGVGEVEIQNINLPAGNYLIPINGFSDKQIKVLNGRTGEYLTSFIDDKNYFLGDKLHFAKLVVDVNHESSSELTIEVRDRSGDPLEDIDISIAITVVLGDIFKYNPNPMFNNCYDEIKEKMSRLDINQKYDYTHVPNPDDLIPDPILSKSFWDKNHVYNPFTIAQLNADAIDYRFIT